MPQTYRTLRVARSDAGVLSVVIDAPPMNLIGPELVRDLTKVAEYAAKAGGPRDASLGMLWHKLSELPVVTIAKIRGRARGAGSELALACDTQGLQTRGPLELNLGDRLGSPWP